MANIDYTYDGIMNGSGYFQKESANKASMSVKRMQMKLYRLGYTVLGTPDGFFGNDTESAIKQFQVDHNLTQNGYGDRNTLIMLDDLSPDSTVEHYGRELTHSEILNGYNNSDITAMEAIARCIYGEDPVSEEGQAAVAKEIYNRKNSVRNFISSNVTNTWRGIVYSSGQYAVLTQNNTLATQFSRAPDPYSDSWKNCTAMARVLIGGVVPVSTLGKQCFHIANGYAYPSNAVDATKVQIPAGTGNKFYDTMANPN